MGTIRWLAYLADWWQYATYTPTRLDGGDTTPSLTERVQVLLSPDQVTRLRAITRERGKSMGALDLPVADWEQMERESMRGCQVE